MRRTPLSWSDIPAVRKEPTDRGAVHVGALLTAGWRSSFDLEARYFATKRIAVGVRSRFELERGSPHANEVELAYTFGAGKLTLFDELDLRTRLVAAAAGGIATVDDPLPDRDTTELIASAGLAFRLDFPCGFLVQLGARIVSAPGAEVFAGIAIPLPR